MPGDEKENPKMSEPSRHNEFTPSRGGWAEPQSGTGILTIIARRVPGRHSRRSHATPLLMCPVQGCHMAFSGKEFFEEHIKSHTTAPKHGTNQSAEHDFVNLLKSTVNLKELMQPVVELHEEMLDLCSRIQGLLESFSDDLESELYSEEHRQISRFFKTSSRSLSRVILESAESEWIGADHLAACETGSAYDGADSDESDPNTSVPGLRELVAPTQSLLTFIAGLYHLIHRPFEFGLKKLLKDALDGSQSPQTEEQMKAVVSELIYSRPDKVTWSKGKRVSSIIRLKDLLGNCLPRGWDWGPLTPSRRQVPLGYAILTWKCVCGDTREEVVSEPFAEAIVWATWAWSWRSPSTTFDNSPDVHPHQWGSHRTQSHSTFPAGSLSSFMLNPQSSMTSTAPQIAVPMPPIASRYVLFMVDSDTLHLRPIESQSLCNGQLFSRMRSEYRQVKGWLRSWFGLMTFSHCDFYKFEAWMSQRYCERGPGIPPISDQRYFYSPRPMDNEPPISPHEFYDRFYRRVTTEACLMTSGGCCSEHDAVDRIPQKKDTEEILTDGRPQFWGIIAREKKSGLRMLVYIFIACIPGLVFFFLWLFAVGSDSLQDASVLLMVSFSLLGILYATQLF